MRLKVQQVSRLGFPVEKPNPNYWSPFLVFVWKKELIPLIFADDSFSTRYYSLSSPCLDSLSPSLSITPLKTSFLSSQSLIFKLILLLLLLLLLFWERERDVCGAANPAIGSEFHRRRTGWFTGLPILERQQCKPFLFYPRNFYSNFDYK